MGWTFYQATCYKNGKVDRLAECRKEFKNDFHFPILKDTMIGTTYYAAMQSPKGYVFPLVVLTSVENGEFGYKDMEGGMGPCYYDCPESILKLITIEDKGTKEWINNCRKIQKTKKDIKKMLKEVKEEYLTIKMIAPFSIVFKDDFKISEGETVYLEYFDRNLFVLKNSKYAIRQKMLEEIGIDNISIVNSEKEA